MNTRKEKRGFTLIELLLYVGVSSTMLLASVLFVQTLLEARVKNQTIAEVEQQGLQAVQRITQAVRNAESITSPTPGSTSAALTLNVVPGADDPTVFALSSGVLEVTEGVSSAESLTNTRVTVSNLTFENLSRSSTPGTVRVSFTVTYVNTTGRNEYNFEKTFRASASLRHP